MNEFNRKGIEMSNIEKKLNKMVIKALEQRSAKLHKVGDYDELASNLLNRMIDVIGKQIIEDSQEEFYSFSLEINAKNIPCVFVVSELDATLEYSDNSDIMVLYLDSYFERYPNNDPFKIDFRDFSSCDWFNTVDFFHDEIHATVFSVQEVVVNKTLALKVALFMEY